MTKERRGESKFGIICKKEWKKERENDGKHENKKNDNEMRGKEKPKSGGRAEEK